MSHRVSLRRTAASLALILAPCIATLAAGAAQADCKPVITAYLKADATRLFAIYSVDSLDQAPKGEPMFVTIGDVKYSENDVQKGPLEIVKDGYKKGGASTGFEANSLRKDEQKGDLKCTPLPDRKFGSEMAAGYHVGSPGGGALDPGSYDFYVSRATGLPLMYSIDPESGGFRYVYGSAVKAPPPSQVRQ